MQRVMITLPNGLLQKTDRAAKKLGQNRSEFIRQTLRAQLEIMQRQEFEALLAEGYQEMSAQAATLSAEAQAAQAAAAEGIWLWDE
jgi:metal-responsive CopG/Arc/MetJ family transcriptional regulator